MSRKLTINLDIEKLPKGYYVATSKDVQGLVAQAKTFEEVVDIAKDVAQVLLRTQSKNRKSHPISSERIFYPLQLTL